MYTYTYTYTYIHHVTLHYSYSIRHLIKLFILINQITEKYSPEREEKRFKKEIIRTSTSVTGRKARKPKPAVVASPQELKNPWKYYQNKLLALLKQGETDHLFSLTSVNRVEYYHLQAKLKVIIQLVYNINKEDKRHKELQDDALDEDGMVDVSDVTCSRCFLEDQPNNDIYICDGKDCFRAYHVKCLNPKINIKKISENPDEAWFCHECYTVGKCFECINYYYKTRYLDMNELFPDLPQGLYESHYQHSLRQTQDDNQHQLLSSHDPSIQLKCNNDDETVLNKNYTNFKCSDSDTCEETSTDDSDDDDYDDRGGKWDKASVTIFQAKRTKKKSKTHKSVVHRPIARQTKSSSSSSDAVGDECEPPPLPAVVSRLANCTGCSRVGVFNKSISHKITNPHTSKTEICGYYTVNPRPREPTITNVTLVADCTNCGTVGDYKHVGGEYVFKPHFVKRTAHLSGENSVLSSSSSSSDSRMIYCGTFSDNPRGGELGVDNSGMTSDSQGEQHAEFRQWDNREGRGEVPVKENNYKYNLDCNLNKDGGADDFFTNDDGDIGCEESESSTQIIKFDSQCSAVNPSQTSVVDSCEPLNNNDNNETGNANYDPNGDDRESIPHTITNPLTSKTEICGDCTVNPHRLESIVSSMGDPLSNFIPASNRLSPISEDEAKTAWKLYENYCENFKIDPLHTGTPVSQAQGFSKFLKDMNENDFCNHTNQRYVGVVLERLRGFAVSKLYLPKYLLFDNLTFYFFHRGSLLR